ncbi:golgin subfamily A member 6-like protein 2 [Myripristis murdjan]|uniref:golgin subfamily A member 6-like protein 2 n=1 Tax=Myripristis murdjan TaxID=586833 RepID=UPI0011763B71|nr:golgin subfamily A member 6-like protein 2 [Myripristis murdjan]
MMDGDKLHARCTSEVFGRRQQEDTLHEETFRQTRQWRARDTKNFNHGGPRDNECKKQARQRYRCFYNVKYTKARMTGDRLAVKQEADDRDEGEVECRATKPTSCKGSKSKKSREGDAGGRAQSPGTEDISRQRESQRGEGNKTGGQETNTSAEQAGPSAEEAERTGGGSDGGEDGTPGKCGLGRNGTEKTVFFTGKEQRTNKTHKSHSAEEAQTTPRKDDSDLREVRTSQQMALENERSGMQVCLTDVEHKEHAGNEATGQEATDRSETAQGPRDSQPRWRHEDKQQWDVWEEKTNELKPRGRDDRGFAAREQRGQRHESRSRVQSRWTRGDTVRSQTLRNRYRWRADGESRGKAGGAGPGESEAGGEKSAGEERSQLTRGGGRFHASEVEEESRQGSGRSSPPRLTGERSGERKTTRSAPCGKTWRHIGRDCALRLCSLSFPPRGQNTDFKLSRSVHLT